MDDLTSSNFVELYMEQKLLGKRDKEIAVLFGLKIEDLGALKRFLGAPNIKKRKNEWLTESELQTAERNGLTRRLALRRRRDLGWSIMDSISRPNYYRYRTNNDVSNR